MEPDKDETITALRMALDEKSAEVKRLRTVLKAMADRIDFISGNIGCLQHLAALGERE
jgi:predicted dinucleotide-utilizing enzyme